MRSNLLSLLVGVALLSSTAALSQNQQNIGTASSWFKSDECNEKIAKGELKEAAEGIQERLAKTANDPDGWLILEGLEEALGKLDQSLNAYQNFIANCPEDSRVTRVHKQMDKLREELKTEPAELTALLSPEQMYLVSTLMNDYGMVRWPTSHMPLRVFITPSQPNDPISTNFILLTRSAFADWADHSQSKISFKFVDQPQTADIIFTWTKDQGKIDQRGGYTTFERKPNDELKATIVCCTIAEFLHQPINDQQALSIARHEIGHSLGLGHSLNPADIMFLMTRVLDVSHSDVAVLKQLYTESPSQLYDPLIAQYVKLLGPDSATVGEALTTYGRALNREKQFAQSTEICSRALSILSKGHFRDDPQLFKVVRELARSYYKRNQYAEAEPLYEREARILESHPGDPADYTKALQHLAYCYWHTNKDFEAEEVYKKLLSHPQQLEANDVDTADCLYRIGYLAYKNKRYEEAFPYYRRACNIYRTEKVNNLNSKQCEADYDHLASYLHSAGTGKSSRN